MNVETLQPLGASVTCVDLAAPASTDVTELRTLLAERGVVVFPGQSLGDAAFTEFLGAFGPLAFTKGEKHVGGHPDLNVVSNVGRTSPPKSNFHIDTTYVASPPAYTALRAVQIPERGGATLFSDQYRAYETLPPDLRERLDGRTVTHVATGVELGPEDEAAAEHPVFRPHPITGRIALYLSTARRCAHISGMDDDEAAQVVAALLEHSTRDDNVYRHDWAPGDVVMWDNSAVLHKADHSDVVGDRVMHRGMVAGYGVSPGDLCAFG
jgi:taurine dioxygenase